MQRRRGLIKDYKSIYNNCIYNKSVLYIGYEVFKQDRREEAVEGGDVAQGGGVGGVMGATEGWEDAVVDGVGE